MMEKKSPQASYGKEGGRGSFGSKLHAYWYRFRVYTDKHTMKFLYVWAATTLTIMGIKQYQYVNGKSSSSDEETGKKQEKAVKEPEIIQESELKELEAASDQAAKELKELKDSFVQQSELEQKLHSWIVKLGLNKTTHDSHKPK